MVRTLLGRAFEVARLRRLRAAGMPARMTAKGCGGLAIEKPEGRVCLY